MDFVDKYRTMLNERTGGLDKSPERLAQEIKGKDRKDAEKHLVKYGMSPAVAGAIVARITQTKSQKVSTDIKDIAKTISDEMNEDFEPIDEAELMHMLGDRDSKSLMKLVKTLKDDKQSVDLLKQVYDTFNSKLDKTEKGALNRLLNLLQRGAASPEMARNQIFKIANELKIKLPSSMF